MTRPANEKGPLKRGALNKDEKHKIELEFRKRSPEAIAMDLNRSVDLVLKYIEEMGDANPHSPILRNLRSTTYYRTLQNKYTAEELEMFEVIYVDLAMQLGVEDLKATELRQLYGYIDLEVREHRLSQQARHLFEQIERGQRELDEALGRKKNADVNRKVGDLKAELQGLRQQNKLLEGQMDAIAVSKRAELKALKATRDQRIDKIDNTKINFPELLKNLQNEEYRRSEAEMNQMAIVSAQKEKDRLARPIKYADGIIDRPLLTPETVQRDD